MVSGKLNPYLWVTKTRLHELQKQGNQSLLLHVSPYNAAWLSFKTRNLQRSTLGVYDLKVQIIEPLTLRAWLNLRTEKS